MTLAKSWHFPPLKKKKKDIMYPPTGVALSCQGGLHQTKQNKEKKTQARIHLYYKRSGEGFIVKNICCAILPVKTPLKMPIVKKTCCVLLPLSFMKSFKMNICCVLLKALLWRRYSCVLLSSSAVYFYQCVYQKLYASGAKSRAGRICMSGTCYQ